MTDTIADLRRLLAEADRAIDQGGYDPIHVARSHSRFSAHGGALLDVAEAARRVVVAARTFRDTPDGSLVERKAAVSMMELAADAAAALRKLDEGKP